MKVIIVGGGVIGAATAYHLAQRGAEVTVIAAGGGATFASFGWINASFALNDDHFRLRLAGLEAYSRLAHSLDIPLSQCGCLSWEFQGEALHQTAQDLNAKGYPVEVLNRAQAQALEPAVAGIPDETLFFPTEAVAEPAALVAALLRDVRVVSGVRVTQITDTGVMTDAGAMRADEVLVAAGTGTQALLATADIPLPMVPRPAYVMQTKPIPPVLTHVIATDAGEVRQRPDGVIVMPTSVTHQADRSETLDLTGPQAAEAALARLRGLLPGQDLDWAEVIRADRPMPADELPVAGRVRPGLSVAVMHSGLTLGALMGDVMATEITQGPSNQTSDLLAAFRPDRFA